MGKIATVGTFDGIHRGHRQILLTLRDAAQTLGLKPEVITFRNHPLDVVAPTRAPKAIMPAEKKISILRAEGFDAVLLEFTPEMAAMSARRWLESLRDDRGVSAIVVGYDNTFGHDGRSMSLEDYRRLAESLGMRFFSAPELPDISSSKIRRSILEGNMENAAAMLAYPFEIEGEVVRGKQLGRTIDVPTANILPPPGLILPPPGAYATRAIRPDGREMPAVTNIGRRPTVEDRAEAPISIETHIPDFRGDLYGKTLKILFFCRLRPERKFDSLADLKIQIAKDIELAKHKFQDCECARNPAAASPLKTS